MEVAHPEERHGPETLAERVDAGAADPRRVRRATTRIRTLLGLARDAAHEMERPAAPLTTFLVGVAVGLGATLDAAAGTASALLLDAAEPPPR